jgi:D-glycero-D-manno-heptose 1,7-bisphosphate phosphatase
VPDSFRDRPPLLAGELLEAGCWRSIGSDRFEGRPALFLDRDGVVVEEVDYLSRVEQVALTRHAADVIAAFNGRGVPVVLATNQSGVARGYFDWARFAEIQDEIAERLAAQGAHLDAIFACGYHEKGQGALALGGHSWRKPGPGMFIAAAKSLGVDLARSVMVGDRAQDLAAARAAGLAGGLHVAGGHGASEAEQQAAAALQTPLFQVRLGEDIGEALAYLPTLAGQACGS